MFNLDECLTLIAFNSSKMFTVKLEKRLKPMDVSVSKWLALYHIYHNKDITQRDLATKMALTEPTVGRLMSDMELDKEIKRTNSAADRRIKHVRLTKKGINLYEKAIPVILDFKNELTAGISDDHIQLMKDVLDTMVKNLNGK